MALAIIVIHTSPLFALAAGAVIGVLGRGRFSKGVEKFFSSERQNEKRKERPESKNKRQEQGLERDFTRGKGWNPLALPADMTATLTSDRTRAFFTVSGMKDFVEGRVDRNGDVRYSFAARNLDEARRCKEKLAAFNGAVRMDERNGVYVFSSSKASSINDFVKAVYPQRMVPVERVDTHVSQYVIPFCKSAEEAMEKLRLSPEAFSPVNSYERVTDRVDGLRNDYLVGRPVVYGPNDALPLGSYVLSIESSEAHKGNVLVAGGLDADEAREAARAGFVAGEDNVWKEMTTEPKVSDQTLDVAPRFCIDDNGDFLDVYNDETAGAKLEKEGYKAYVICDSLRDTVDLVTEGRVPAGALVILDKHAPDAVPGQFVVSVDAGSDVLSKLAIQGEASPSHAANFQNYGLNARDLEVSSIMDNIEKNGYGTLRVKEGMDIGRGRVNGVPIDDFAGRVVNGRLMGLSDEQMNQWLKDAAMVQSVTVTIDKKNAQLEITSVVNNTRLVEKRQLTDKEMMEFVRRGEVSRAEMKDLLLQMHPEYFKTYSINGRGIFTDPVKDFMKGQKPQADKTLSESWKQQFSASKKQAEVKKNAPRHKTALEKKPKAKLSM